MGCQLNFQKSRYQIFNPSGFMFGRLNYHISFYPASLLFFFLSQLFLRIFLWFSRRFVCGKGFVFEGVIIFLQSPTTLILCSTTTQCRGPRPAPQSVLQPVPRPGCQWARSCPPPPPNIPPPYQCANQITWQGPSPVQVKTKGGDSFIKDQTTPRKALWKVSQRKKEMPKRFSVVVDFKPGLPYRRRFCL